MKILVAYSGGKDSQASLIWSVKKYGAKNIEAVFEKISQLMIHITPQVPQDEYKLLV